MNATTVEETRAPQSITTEVLKEKYCLPHETTEEEVFKRVAKAVAAVEKTQDLRDKWDNEFFLNMQAGAIGAGRIMAAAGAPLGALVGDLGHAISPFRLESRPIEVPSEPI